MQGRNWKCLLLMSQNVYLLDVQTFPPAIEEAELKKKCESMERQLIDTKCKDSSVFDK